MNIYTRKDIILFTEDPRLENAIGKKVYAADSPSSLLSLANKIKTSLAKMPQFPRFLSNSRLKYV